MRRTGITVFASASSAVLILLLGACAKPATQFIAPPDRSLVLELPASWSQIDTGEVLGSAAATQSGWTAFYDAADVPAADHLNALQAASQMSAPVLNARSIELSEAQRDELTPQDLLDFFQPVSDQARTAQENLAHLNAEPPPVFRLISTSEVKTETAEGFRVVYGYDFGEGELIRDQVVVTDPEKTRVHGVQVRCSTTCYQERAEEIDAVVRSLTVKPQPK